MSLDRRSIRVLVVVGVVLGVATVPIAYALTNDAPVDRGVTVSAVSGPDVTIGEATQADLSDVSASSTETRIVSDAGNVTVGGPADGVVQVDDFAGTFVNVSSVDSAGGTLVVDPDTKPAADLSGQYQSFAWRDPTPGDQTTDFSYSATSSVTVALPHGSSGDFVAVAQGSGEFLAADSDGDSTMEFDLPSGNHQVRIERQDGGPTVSNGAPTGRINDSTPMLSVDVADPDFTSGDSDRVTVTIDHDGTQVYQTELTSNTTVSYTLAPIAPGSHSWTVTATDAYGASDTQSYSYTAGAELRIYNASAPSTLVTESVEVDVYSDGDQVFSRSTSDGTIDLSTLPEAPDEGYELVLTSDANYTSRRIVVPDLVGTTDVYMLPTSADTVSVEFRLQDFTGGQFDPDETRLRIERPITKDYDGDGTPTTKYQPVLASTFGVAGGFPSTLVRNQRYRLRVENRAGDQRVLGSYTASADTVEPLTIKGLQFDPPEGQGYQTRTNVTAGNLTWKYMDPSGETSALNVTVENDSGGVVYNDSITGGVENYSAYNIQLNNSSSYTLSWNATRGGQSVGETRPVGADAPLVSIPLQSDWLGTFGLIMVVFVLSLADVRKTSYVAMSAVAVAGMLMAIQAVTIFPPLWFAAALIAVGTHLRTIQTRSPA